MTTLSTHDTKRGEDTRARLGVLSELPREWSALVDALRAASAPYRSALLDGRTEYLLWQTLAGTWTRRRPDRRGPAGRVPDQGDPRGEDPDHLDGARRAVRGARCSTPRGRRCVDPTVAELLARLGAAHPAGGPRGDPRHQARPADAARASPDVYQGTEVPDPVARRPGQPPARRRRAARRPPRPARRRRRPARPRRREAAGHLARAARCAATLPGGVRRPGQRVPARWPTRRGTRSPTPGPSPATRGSRSSRPGSPPPSTGSAAGRTTRSRCPTATGTTCSPTGPSPGGVVDVGAAARPAARRPARAGGGLTRCCPASGRRRRARVDLVVGDERRPLAARRRLVGRRPRPRRTAPTTPSRSTAARRGPTRAAPGSRTACTARAACSTPRPSPWTDDGWSGRRRARRRDVRAARRHVHAPRARSTRRDRAPRRAGLARRRPGRAHAGRPVQRRARLGLRRRRDCSRCTSPTAARRRCSAFVDAAHARGLGVCLDVVHNHLGPSGNYLGEFGPYFTDAHQTPWGSAINLDGPGSDEVRRWICDSALRWFRDFHVDALRLDAVHALVDDSPTGTCWPSCPTRSPPLAADAGPAAVAGRRVRPQRPRLDHPDRRGRLGHDRAVGRRRAPRDPRPGHRRAARLLRRLRLPRGAAQGADQRVRARRRPARRSAAATGAGPVPPGTDGHRFVVAASDARPGGQPRARRPPVGAPRPRPARGRGRARPARPRSRPMLFMGEEWGARTPWQFFTDHPEPDLAAAVRDGRRREFGGHGWDVLYGGDIEVPDPQDPATFRAQHPRPRRARRPGAPRARPAARLVPRR